MKYIFSSRCTKLELIIPRSMVLTELTLIDYKNRPITVNFTYFQFNRSIIIIV